MFKIILLLVMISFLFSSVFSQDAEDNVSKAKTFVDLPAKNNFSEAKNYFSDEVKAIIKLR